MFCFVGEVYHSLVVVEVDGEVHFKDGELAGGDVLGVVEVLAPESVVGGDLVLAGGGR